MGYLIFSRFYKQSPPKFNKQMSRTNAKENGGSNKSDKESSFKANLFEVLLNYDAELNLNPFKLFFTTDILCPTGSQNMLKNCRNNKKCQQLVTILKNEEPKGKIQTTSNYNYSLLLT
ncbi:ANL_HP_G0188570.mRNA.1.CDS.1 [Saccharomyces cerevisiae]|nr:ANL_HP_G0188570.mRNA.1.CDS.1 [Saccharomyces cerevisiae]CAI6400301.1 ANL_HP_G0188570.mRNA.1.CDS.1 [Saccharomyces cerevisiae]